MRAAFAGFLAGVVLVTAVAWAIALQEEMQRRIAAELDLDPVQAERLKQWSSSYGFQVNR